MGFCVPEVRPVSRPHPFSSYFFVESKRASKHTLIRNEKQRSHFRNCFTTLPPFHAARDNPGREA